jgi:hypothetical protein
MKNHLYRFLTAALAVSLLWLVPPSNREALAQGLRLMSGGSSNLALVDANGNLHVRLGTLSGTGDACYIASAGTQVSTAAIIVSVEAPAGQKLTIERICASSAVATAAVAVTVTVQRRTTASSAGTALTAEGTGTTSVSKLDPVDGNYPGVARLGGTPGTAGAVVDQWGYTAGELGAGAADTSSNPPVCKQYGAEMGSKPITVASGVTNGLTVNISTHGAGALASGAISVEMCVR